MDNIIRDRRPVNEHRSYAACRSAFEKLANDPEALTAIAVGNISKWQKNETCGSWYIYRWKELLKLPLEEARALALASTDEAAALRQNHPFAGFFTESERQALKRVSIEEVAARAHH